ncbi:sirohydrochlorin chelatase [Kitasatospora viridis]|uniref:Cobalamin biosynthesis protein CbiX n=1 Tax=Kitasatospora viridis TaxID=281105 RepID=A0A561SG24_9ACTN|nr:hypothetical protein [Kitasatospora viridis]TWF73831.1 hypothetical protein FHX73_15458 [Kitasatospora viridis]
MAPAAGGDEGDGGGAATLVLVGGHESGRAAALRPQVEAGRAFRAVGVGRELARAVTEALAHADRPVCVLPMTLGRDPRLVAETARALRWLTGPATHGRVALAEPFGAAVHLVGWLRAAAGRIAGDDRTEATVLVTAPAGGPFDDAELFRIARLVRQHGTHRSVEVAFHGGDPGIAEGVDRCRRLGARRVVMLPAGFGPAAPEPVPGAEDGGPLLAPPALGEVLLARTQAALHRLRHGEDGIAAGLDAEHGHGYPHSHPDPDTDGTHPHPHPHVHSHPHPHDARQH